MEWSLNHLPASQSLPVLITLLPISITFFFLPAPHSFYEHIGQVKATAWQVGGCVCVRERDRNQFWKETEARGVGECNGIPLSLVKPGHATATLCRKMMPSIGRWANSTLTSQVKRVMKKTKNSCRQIILMLFLQFCQLWERFCLEFTQPVISHREFLITQIQIHFWMRQRQKRVW